MFRGKESSNRIELSQLVQDYWILVFSAPCGSGGWEVGGWSGGWLGGTPTHMHTHTQACTHMHAHACVVNMIISCKWLPPLVESWEFPMMSYAHVHACMHVHVHVCGGHPPTTPTHIHPTPYPPGGTPGISQNSIALELIKIFQFRLKIWNLWRLPHPWVVYGLVGWWVGWWVASGQNTKNLKIVDWIKIIQFCLKIYDL